MTTAVTITPTLVIGHRNPDMDAIAAAVGYAHVLNALGSDRYVAGRLGEINPQVAYALDHFKATAPDLIGDVAPQRKVVLVDHNEVAQSVPGLEKADLVEVLDHHRLGNAPTTLPIRFYVDPVGSTSTLVTERAIANHLTFPAPIAGLLLSGILSDTLVFKSPTNTPRDRTAAAALATMAGLTGVDAIETYGAALLAAGAGLSGKSTDEIVNSDLKEYEGNGRTAGVVQVEVAGFDELPRRLADIQVALAHKLADQHYALAVLMVTDIIGNNSRLVVAGAPSMLAAFPYNRLPDGTLDAPGMVSRKKQLLPVVLDVLAKG